MLNNTDRKGQLSIDCQRNMQLLSSFALIQFVFGHCQPTRFETKPKGNLGT